MDVVARIPGAMLTEHADVQATACLSGRESASSERPPSADHVAAGPDCEDDLALIVSTCAAGRAGLPRAAAVGSRVRGLSFPGRWWPEWLGVLMRSRGGTETVRQRIASVHCPIPVGVAARSAIDREVRNDNSSVPGCLSDLASGTGST